MSEVFFYGLYMDEEILRGLGCNPIKARIVVLEGYGLRIGEKATLVESEDEYCYGQLIEMSDSEIESLYSPNSLKDYYQIAVEVKDEKGNRITTSAYVLPESKLSGSNIEYARKLHASASRLGITKDYLKVIEKYTA